MHPQNATGILQSHFATGVCPRVQIDCTDQGAQFSRIRFIQKNLATSFSVPPCLRASVPPCLRASVPPCLRASVPPCLRASVPPCLRVNYEGKNQTTHGKSQGDNEESTCEGSARGLCSLRPIEAVHERTTFGLLSNASRKRKSHKGTEPQRRYSLH